ncbi:MAG: hypothetical protein JSV91_15895, partial [Phycisphaerales bacterium]
SEPPFEFPAQWSPGQMSKYIDVICHLDREPWVVELKDRGSGQGEYYRHGITQAVLYRHFIRHSGNLRDWFDEKDIDAQICQAAVAFPEFGGPLAVQLESEHKAIAGLFGVQLARLQR